MNSETLTPEVLPIGPAPVDDPSVEAAWQSIERASRISRKSSRDAMRDHIAATTATALTFNNQLTRLSLLSKVPDFEASREIEGGPVENPSQPGPSNS